MYKNVLMPIAIGHGGTTQTALKVAKQLAGTDGNVTALHVLEALPPYILAELPEGIAEQGQADALEALRMEAGEGVRAVVVTGHAALTILEFAEENQVDCIVVASHQPGYRDYFLGSTAARVVRHAHCAVHVVR
ncbi:MAG: universal stress protein [Pseudomonadota bacterium]